MDINSVKLKRVFLGKRSMKYKARNGIQFNCSELYMARVQAS